LANPVVDAIVDRLQDGSGPLCLDQAVGHVEGVGGGSGVNKKKVGLKEFNPTYPIDLDIPKPISILILQISVEEV
jgi:hypothetical protein